MLYYLRIAVTALCLTACVLLIALWVRSFYRNDDFRIPLPWQRTLRIDSLRGHLILHAPTYLPHLWEWSQRVVLNDSDVWSNYDSQLRPWHWIWNGGPTAEALVLPHWFFVLTTGAMTGVPWLPWSKRFSLRTLLIATTLVALGLGIIVWSS